MFRIYKSFIPILFSVRFLTLISHLVLLLLLILDRSPNVNKQIQLSESQYQASDFSKLDNDYVIWLSISIALLGTEILSNFFTISSLVIYQSLISIITHSIGVFILFGYYTEAWKFDDFKWIFGFCTAVPFLTEILSYFDLFVLKKSYV